MPVYYDLRHPKFDVSDRDLRKSYITRYFVKILLLSYRSVTESRKTTSQDLHNKLMASIMTLIESDVILGLRSNESVREEMKASQGIEGDNIPDKTKERLWKRSLDYKKSIRIWNSLAPKESEVPSGTTDVLGWRHDELRKRLFVEKHKNKTGEDMPSHWQPSNIWPAYIELVLINDVKFAAPEERDVEFSVRQNSIGRQQQRIEDLCAKRVAKKARAATSFSLIEAERQKTAETFVKQKQREIENKESHDLLTTSISILEKLEETGLGLDPSTQNKLKKAAVQGSLSALNRMIKKSKEGTNCDNQDLNNNEDPNG